MRCPTCGAENDDRALKCQVCDMELTGNSAGGRIGVQRTSAVTLPDYNTAALLLTLFGCVPLGILARLYAAEVHVKLALGDERSARESARRARKWCWLAAAAGILIWGVGISAAAMLVQMAEAASS